MLVKLRTPKLLLLSLATLVALPALAVDPVNTTLFGNLALEGYDPVAYFEKGAPAKGSKSHTFDWQGATWRFENAANRDLFAADPKKYAPQYGGYCAYAVSQGKTASIDPEAWNIVDGKLYLNYNKKIQATWSQDIPGFIQKADTHWPKLLED